MVKIISLGLLIFLVSLLYYSNSKAQRSTTSFSNDFEHDLKSDQKMLYGAFILVSKDKVSNTEVVKNELKRVKALGFNLVGQVFSGSSTKAEWLTFADLVLEENLLFIPFIRDEIPTLNRETKEWHLGIHGEFLDEMKDHPALYAMFIYDEPHRHKVVSSEIAQLYSQAKKIAPKVKIGVGFSGEIWRAETKQYGKNSHLFAFKRGLCDVCMISGLEFRIDQNGNKGYQREDAINNHKFSRTVISREAPEVELWSTVQTFGSDKSTYYMPTSHELQDLLDILLSDEMQNIKRLNGLNFQTWGDPEPGQNRGSLGDEEFKELQDLVQNLIN